MTSQIVFFLLAQLKYLLDFLIKKKVLILTRGAGQGARQRRKDESQQRVHASKTPVQSADVYCFCNESCRALAHRSIPAHMITACYHIECRISHPIGHTRPKHVVIEFV